MCLLGLEVCRRICACVWSIKHCRWERVNWLRWKPRDIWEYSSHSLAYIRPFLFSFFLPSFLLSAFISFQTPLKRMQTSLAPHTTVRSLQADRSSAVVNEKRASHPTYTSGKIAGLGSPDQTLYLNRFEDNSVKTIIQPSNIDLIFSKPILTQMHATQT